MENGNKQVCRLCLEVILDGECEVIEEIKKEILDVLLITIDFDISDNAVACKKCLGRLQNCFDFKSICFYVDDYIAPFVDGDVQINIRNVFKKVIKTSDNVNLDDSQICRLCMSFIEDKACSHDTSDLKDGLRLEYMLRNCLPEVNLNSVDEPLVCKPCLNNMTKYYEFMKSCKEVEQKIKNYIRNVEDHGITSKIILEDVLELINCDTLGKPIRRQWLHVENETECLKNEEAANIKCEEIEIKDELDMQVEASEAVESGNGNNSGKNGSLKKRKIPKSNTKGKKFCCPKCPYSTNRNGDLKIHMRSHSDNEVHACILCSFVTDSRLSLKAHLTDMHRGSTKAFGCPECSYETDRKRYLQGHIIKHKDKSEVEMHKCSQCPYKTKFKADLWRHRNMLHSKNIEMYKCEKCSFSSKYKVSFVRHQLLHKNPEEIQKHKCEMCEFETSYKHYLVKHMLMHENLELTSKFQCEKCPYRCKRRRELVKHMLTHPNNCAFSCDQCTYSSNYKYRLQRHKLVHQKEGIREMYKCELCNYQAKTSISIKDHMINIHTDPSKLPTFKCALCPYKSTLKKSLSKHITHSHNHKDQPTFKCAFCLYETKRKSYLPRHLLSHQEVASIKCEQCDFRTKHKENLSQHMKRHDSLKPLVFKCDKCEYCTWRKDHLNRHKMKHMELEETIAYKCAMCDFQTKYKSSLRIHIKMCLKNKNDKKKKK